MSVSNHPDFDGHESVNFLFHERAGLRAIIAVHNTALGPALGGCRMRPYADETEAVKDVLRLSAGMTRKSAVTGLPFGGGKTVIWADPQTDKTPELLRAFGERLKDFEGRYFTGEDMGMEREDFLIVGERANNLVGVRKVSRFDSSGEVTAIGVMTALEATLAAYGDALDGKTAAVQGLGHVGFELCALLHAKGVRLTVSNMDAAKLEKAKSRFEAQIVEPDAIYDAEADIFAPCAMGGIVNRETLPRLRCRYIVGAANNQLSDNAIAAELSARGIVYVPDYVANAGGLIRVGHEALAQGDGRAYDDHAMLESVYGLGAIVTQILDDARRREVTPLQAAEDFVLARIARAEAERAATAKAEARRLD